MRIAPVSPTARLADFGHKREHTFICHECGRPKTFNKVYQHEPQINCITPGCAQSIHKPIPPGSTTWTACKFL